MFEINIEKALKEGTLREKIDNMKREIEQRQEEIKKCEKALEKYKKPKLATPFSPKVGEKFYGYYYNGSTFSDKIVCVDESDIYSKRKDVEGLYKTEEEAKLAYEKRCAEMEILSMCDGLHLREGNEIYYMLCDLRGIQEFIAVFDGEHIPLTPYRFASRESCEDAIYKLGYRKLRLIFNIPAEN